MFTQSIMQPALCKMFALPCQLQEIVTSQDIRPLLDNQKLTNLAEKLSSQDLVNESRLLHRLKYRSKSQQQNSKHFRKLQGVDRYIRLLNQLKEKQMAEELAKILEARPQINIAKQRISDREFVLPEFSYGVEVITWIYNCGKVINEIQRSAQDAAAHLTVPMSRGFFLPICTTYLALSARIIWLMNDILPVLCEAYSELLQLIAIFPRLGKNDKNVRVNLPISLEAKKLDGRLQMIIGEDCDILKLADQKTEEYGVMVKLGETCIEKEQATLEERNLQQSNLEKQGDRMLLFQDKIQKELEFDDQVAINDSSTKCYPTLNINLIKGHKKQQKDGKYIKKLKRQKLKQDATVQALPNRDTTSKIYGDEKVPVSSNTIQMQAKNDILQQKFSVDETSSIEQLLLKKNKQENKKRKRECVKQRKDVSKQGAFLTVEEEEKEEKSNEKSGKKQKGDGKHKSVPDIFSALLGR
eukprot:TRINITY_DN14902_c1_g1_i3.p1 TRINITY_DN14902_c1_g1~~TRINITY_DN14902_c1_g1_i3.p1  ORF type:complete len:469 (+),score=41.62 TRINITY_DN14902_c1_g1_i3:69-1475(+)